MNKDIQIILLLATIFVLGSLVVNAYGESYDLNGTSVPVISDDASVNANYQNNIIWKERQLQEKFNNLDPNSFISYEKQREQVQRTQDYLMYWGLIDKEPTKITQGVHNYGKVKVVTLAFDFAWKINEGEIIYINIINGDEYPNKTALIIETILSDEKLSIPKKYINPSSEGNIIYYLGWVGALEKASIFSTEFYIPQDFEVITESNGAGDIIITLTEEESDKEFAGLTTTTVISSQYEIIKAVITIYEIDQLTSNELQAISRHELGHAFGLSHSSDPDDLMYETLETGFPYISTCDANAITKLYDGLYESKVLCVKLGE